MIQSGLTKIPPHPKDYSLLHTFGAVLPDPQSLPPDFSIYDGRSIPNQNGQDTRFTPAVRPLPMGCTAETTTTIAGLEDGATYLPDDFYFATPPGTDGEGRDIRSALQTAINRGFKADRNNAPGAKRTAYFNCYSAGAIDDFDAARIALWINQSEKRGVSVGSWWYPEFEQPDFTGSLPLPSFDTKQAMLHNYLLTGWRTIGGQLELEAISWQGEEYGHGGLCFISRPIYNALLAQPWTGAFTLTKTGSATPVPIGYQAIFDHLVYFIRQLFHLN